jgi:GNAT superfamily N-acetyltransferase
VLKEASPAERIARDRLTYSAWGARLSVAQYLTREERMRAHPWAQENMRTWLFGDGLASLETFAMSSGIYGIASVFVEEAKRGHGYATQLVGEVHQWMRGQGARGALLFSDVGHGIYERAGYRAFAGTTYRLRPVPGEFTALSAAEARDRWPATGPAIWPTWEQLDWHWEHERFYREMFRLGPLERCGARQGDAMILWTADWRAGDRLYVLWLDPPDGEVEARLLAAAQAEAARSGLAEVHVWAEALGSGERICRPDSLPMFAAFDPAAMPATAPRALWV